MSKQTELFTPPSPVLVPPETLEAVPQRALTLMQPWASLVALGEKRIETRSWNCKFRGPIAIHAATRFPRRCHDLCLREPFQAALRDTPPKRLPLGRIVAVAHLVDSFCFSDSSDPLTGRTCATHEAEFGDYSQGRFGFVFTDIVMLREPIQAPGMLGLWTMNDAIRTAIAVQLQI